jgi:hypothetical protein
MWPAEVHKQLIESQKKVNFLLFISREVSTCWLLSGLPHASVAIDCSEQYYLNFSGMKFAFFSFLEKNFCRIFFLVFARLAS